MKVAFVNQPIDTILPPYQTSIGACTYGAACSLARWSDVLVYGIKDRHNDAIRTAADSPVSFRLFSASVADRLFYKARTVYTSRFPDSAPISTSRWYYPDFGGQVAADLQKQQCDVIHIQHCSQYAPVIRALNPRSKIVLHLHAEWLSQSNSARLERRLRSVDLVTTVSDYLTEKIRRAFPHIADRCHTTYNGIDAKAFRREKDYSGMKERKVKRILYAGAVSPHKGIHVLLDAFKIIAHRTPDVQLEIAGPFCSYPVQETFDRNDQPGRLSVARFYEEDCGQYLAQLKSQLTPQLEQKVTFLGMVPNADLIKNWYYDCDVFVFPSVCNEGFGIPPIEAMAAGTPVVATRSGAIVETVRDGETGYLVPKYDPRSLADAILKLLGNDALREAMGRAGRQWVVEQFTWDHIADDMRERYAGLCCPEPVPVYTGYGSMQGVKAAAHL
jgi:glycosyltransferase involved in cell wall biosynthesis